MKHIPIPEPLQKRLQLIYGSKEYEALLKTWSVPRKTTLRVNTLKISAEDFEKKAIEQHITLTKQTWNTEAFVLESPSLRDFSETQLYNEGLCYVQSFSSMLPPLVLRPQEGDKVLDLCAAPGSKTSQIAALMNNSGEIVANDASQVRLYRLQANLKRLGVTNTKVQRGVGQGVWHDFPEYFDKTLVDVPCSMEGRILLDDPKSYEDWSVKKVKELQEIQKFLLRSAISATKPGGIIVYSTCTLAPEENEVVIDWILRKEKGTVSLESIDLEDIPWDKPILRWNEKELDPDITKTKRIVPSELFEGFFIAKLRKTDSNV